MIVALEGGDGCGKSTQVERLMNLLPPDSTTFLKFPSKILSLDRMTPIGAVIDSYLKGKYELNERALMHLLAANFYEHLEKLKKTNNSIICDRYTASFIAYSVARGASLQEAKDMICQMPEADLTIWLDVGPEIALQRVANSERFDSLAFQERVRSVYNQLYDQDKWIKIHAGTKSVEEITSQLKSLILY